MGEGRPRSRREVGRIDGDRRARRIGVEQRLERARERLTVRIPAGRSRIECSRHHGVERGRHLGADVSRVWRGRADAGRRQLGRRLTVPRPPSRERFVEDQPEAVDVGRGGRRLPCRLLGAEVVNGAERRPGDRSLGIGRQPGDPEVCDHRTAVAGEEDVAGLHVPMDDPADMRDRERTGDVEPDPSRLARREPSDAAEPRGEILAFDQLHHQERLAIIGSRLEAADDVGMAQDGRREGLAPEPHRDVGVLDDLVAEQLDGDGAVEPDVDRPMDGGHPTDADQLRQPVATRDQPPDVRGGSGGVARLAHAATIAEVQRIGVKWSGRRGSNSRHAAWKAAALPTELLPPEDPHPRLAGSRADMIAEPDRQAAWAVRAPGICQGQLLMRCESQRARLSVTRRPA